MNEMSATLTQPQAASLNWDLDSIFPGGIVGQSFRNFQKEVKNSIEELGAKIGKLPKTISKDTVQDWEEFILLAQESFAALEHGQSYSHCLISEKVDNDAAHQAVGEFQIFRGKYMELMTQFEALTRDQGDSAWELLLSRPKLAPIKFPLNEIRRDARLKMDVALEALAEKLSVNGYHGWNQLYDRMAGDVRVDWEQDGETKQISLGQLAARFDYPDREVRQRAAEKLTAAWKQREGLAAMALNYMAGFRLSLYEKRGWGSPIDEPLRMNRMTRATLDAMWSAINDSHSMLKRYVEAKKKLMGIDHFRWYDEYASVGESQSRFTWDRAWDFIIKNVGNFSPDLKSFCILARDNRWVEAEDRSGKAGGGFCTGLPIAKESRIFMTYGDTYGDLSTLAHELGHAYHSHILLKGDLPYLAQQYPMNLAETASTFNELLVIDAALSQSDDSAERLMLLDQKMQSALTFFCNIQARYNFDSAFYNKRANGPLTPAQLSETMVQAQKDAYGDLLAEDGHFPLFWASKLHFFFTDVPFYNFPYTFGYLFATGVYAHAKKQGASFADGYRAMLADTGVMNAEDVAKKHLNVDLTQKSFWQSACKEALVGLDEFEKLAGK